MRGGWKLMAHGAIFIDYNQQGGPLGAGKAESVNYGMLMEQHGLGRGTILFREMFSAESLTSPHPGFPELIRPGRPITASPWWIISIRTTCLRSWLRSTQCHSQKRSHGNCTEGPRRNRHWDL